MHIIPIPKIVSRQGERLALPILAIAVMYRLQLHECVVEFSPEYYAAPAGVRAEWRRLPEPCAGLYYRWRGIVEDKKQGVVNEDVLFLNSVLAVMKQ